MGKDLLSSVLVLTLISSTHAACSGRPNPDVDSILKAHGWGDLPVDTNTRITSGYIQLAQAFQTIIHPSGSPKVGTLECWFNVAPYASKEVGRGILALQSTMVVLVNDASKWTAVDWGEWLCPSCRVITKRVITNTIQIATFYSSAVNIYAGNFLKNLLEASANNVNVFNERALIDPSAFDPKVTTARVLASKLYELIHTSSFLADMKAIVQTGMNMFEHGNRLIFSHIGGAAHKYLEWRGCGKVQPSAVINGFKLKTGDRDFVWNVPGVKKSTEDTNPDRVQKLFDFAKDPSNLPKGNSDIRDLVPSPTDETKFRQYPCYDIVVAAFALWEEAANELSDGVRKDNLLKWGNNMLAFCEQAEAVAPAFRPHSGCTHRSSSQCHTASSARKLTPLSGEIGRDDLTAVLTPFVSLHLHNAVWTLDGYEKNVVGKKDYMDSGINWGVFSHRYVPILNSFETAYRKPSSLAIVRNAAPNMADFEEEDDEALGASRSRERVLEELDQELRELISQYQRVAKA